MSYFGLNKKKNKNAKKENLLLFPLTYKKILLFNGFSKSPNKNNFNFIIKKQKQKKEIDNLNKKNFIYDNKLPKIENSNSNLSKILKHNLSASENINKILDINSPLNSDRIINNKFNDNLIENNGHFIKKVYLNKQLSEIINTDNNLYIVNNNKKLNKSKDSKILKTELNDKDNFFNKKFIEYDNKFGTPSKIKINNNLNYEYNSPSKLKNLYDNNNIFKEEYKYNSQIKDYYYNSLNKNYKNEKPIKLENISTKTLYSKKEKNKKNNNLNNIKVKSPEELHFYYISIIQEGKKNEIQEK